MYPTIVQSHDEELKRRVLSSLHERGADALDDLQLTVSGGVVTLQGRFRSLDARQRSLECCRHVAAVLRVVDRTEVPEIESGHWRPAALWSPKDGQRPLPLMTPPSPAPFVG